VDGAKLADKSLENDPDGNFFPFSSSLFSFVFSVVGLPGPTIVHAGEVIAGLSFVSLAPFLFFLMQARWLWEFSFMRRVVMDRRVILVLPVDVDNPYVLVV